ncbi:MULTISPECIES: S-layer homology domain-containing protein [unclassified Paenibacillus]|uniref:S-layer homology domain-containing protein n=1 Tax=unclassified Paenibacillus TaxID=185978 RepID=UPI00020D769A|nr:MULTISPECIES: S-layer homology domain-containing protein [unclassified Paenibacillus]EGL19918.1 hypothetical protein HMPREF9413_3293 [Paenibacillus sp. HGF7]EPD88611.1 hypothetical protein HMPREF1207_02040 [Paenibacillus sp. HGH0039]
MKTSKGLRKKMAVTLLACTVMAPAQLSWAASASAASDISGHWAEQQTKQWVDKGYIQGYADGTLKPDKAVTRAEFVSLVNRSFKLEAQGTASFKDVAASDWMYGEVAKAVQAKYIEGYPDGSFRPNASISRQEAAVIVARLLNKTAAQSETAAAFRDQSAIASWGSSAIAAVVSSGVMSGYADRSFKPDAPITRAETIVTLQRAAGETTAPTETTGPGPEETAQLAEGTIAITGPDSVKLTDESAQSISFEAAVKNKNGEAVKDAKVVWSLEFANDHQRWNDEEGSSYGITIDPATGKLNVGWYSWIEDFKVVAKLASDQSVVGSKTVHASQGNIKSVLASNGTVQFVFFEEPKVEDDGYGGKFRADIDSISIAQEDLQDPSQYKELEITKTDYDPATKTATFHFNPIAAAAEKQGVYLSIGYIESTYISGAYFVIPAK